MDINFCEKCDMKMNFYISDEDNKLYLGCKVCGYKKSHDDKASIYNNEYHIDISQIINKNDYLEEDITLPRIEDNKNIRCPNKECISIKENKPSNILYIKYDYENMYYSYICKYCKQNWTNN